NRDGDCRCGFTPPMAAPQPFTATTGAGSVPRDRLKVTPVQAASKGGGAGCQSEVVDHAKGLVKRLADDGTASNEGIRRMERDRGLCASWAAPSHVYWRRPLNQAHCHRFCVVNQRMGRKGDPLTEGGMG